MATGKYPAHKLAELLIGSEFIAVAPGNDPATTDAALMFTDGWEQAGSEKVFITCDRQRFNFFLAHDENQFTFVGTGTLKTGERILARLEKDAENR